MMIVVISRRLEIVNIPTY